MQGLHNHILSNPGRVCQLSGVNSVYRKMYDLPCYARREDSGKRLQQGSAIATTDHPIHNFLTILTVGGTSHQVFEVARIAAASVRTTGVPKQPMPPTSRSYLISNYYLLRGEGVMQVGYWYRNDWSASH